MFILMNTSTKNMSKAIVKQNELSIISIFNPNYNYVKNYKNWFKLLDFSEIFVSMKINRV